MRIALQNFLLTFVSIFVALDIVGTLPFYVAITEGMNPLEQKGIARRSMILALGVALVFMLIGETIFNQLGIMFYDFQIAGGIVLLLISLADLLGNAEVKSRASGQSGIVPLAVPLISGPAVLTTLVLQTSHVGSLITIAALLANYLLAWLLLDHSAGVTRVIGKDGTAVVSKIAALLLAAIAVSMIRSGVFESIENFHR